jgi:Bacterial PH domain
VDGHVFDGDPTWKRLPLEVGSLALWGLTIYGAISALVERITVSDLGVSRRSILGVRHISWPSLARIDVARTGESAKLVARDGRVLPISSDMDGLPVVMKYLERYATHEDATRARVAWGLPSRVGA